MRWVAWMFGSLVVAMGCRHESVVDVDEESGGHGWPQAMDSGGDAEPADDDGGGDDGGPRAGVEEPWDRAELRRLTASQYVHTITDLLGPVPLAEGDAPTDLVLELFAEIGASKVTTEGASVERYEDLARELTGAAFQDETRAAAIVGCDPSSSGCLEDFVVAFGRRAWRRPLTVAERERYTALAGRFADPWEAARFVAAAMLTSPSFVYLVELGEPTPGQPERLRYTSHELAARLSYFLWDGPPDAELAALADAGELTRHDVLVEQAERLAADPRAAAAVQSFFTQYLALAAIQARVFDPVLFPDATPELLADMRGEAERAIEDTVIADGGSLVDLLHARDTFVTQRLAELYGITWPGGQPDAEGFVAAARPEERPGWLDSAAFLATNARATRTAPTLRGVFVQERLLCGELPPPPGNVDTDLPEPDPGDEPQTMRERLAEHDENPECAGCHLQMDPLGLPLEHYDALGRWRDTDQGLPLDVSGELDGVAFDGLPGLAATVADSPRLAECITRRVYRYATGHVESAAENDSIAQLADAAGDGALLDLWVAVASSDGFRHRGTVED